MNPVFSRHDPAPGRPPTPVLLTFETRRRGRVQQSLLCEQLTSADVRSKAIHAGMESARVTQRLPIDLFRWLDELENLDEPGPLKARCRTDRIGANKQAHYQTAPWVVCPRKELLRPRRSPDWDDPKTLAPTSNRLRLICAGVRRHWWTVFNRIMRRSRETTRPQAATAN
jgi:hypothetical protein